MPSFGELLALLAAEHERVVQDASKLLDEVRIWRLAGQEQRSWPRGASPKPPRAPKPPGVSPRALEAKPEPESSSELHHGRTDSKDAGDLRHLCAGKNSSASLSDAFHMIRQGRTLGLFGEDGQASRRPSKSRSCDTIDDSGSLGRIRSKSSNSHSSRAQDLWAASDHDGPPPKRPPWVSEDHAQRASSKYSVTQVFDCSAGACNKDLKECVLHKEWSTGLPPRNDPPRRPFASNHSIRVQFPLNEGSIGMMWSSGSPSGGNTPPLSSELASTERKKASFDQQDTAMPAKEEVKDEHDDEIKSNNFSEISDHGRGTGVSKCSRNSFGSMPSSCRTRRGSVMGQDTMQMWSKFKADYRDPSAHWWLINPDHSQFLEKWDIITMIGLGLVALLAPIQVSMLETRFDGMFVFNCFIDVMFVVDVILQFFMMYHVKTDYGYELEHRHRLIIRHYLRTWFPVDLVSIVPFDLITLLLQAKSLQNLKIIKVVRLMRLLKLIRVLKSSRVFRRFEVRMSITYGSLALLKFFVILSIITHWLANLWALTLVLVEESEGIPRWIDEFQEQEANVSQKTKDTPLKLYLTCVYFTSYTITSVGFGDIGPKNFVEMLCCTLMIIVSGLSWAVVLGQVCGVLANFNTDEQVFRSTMDELNVMMRDRSMPMDMRRRLRSFFLSNKTAQRRMRHQKIILALSPGLRGEVVMQLNRIWINKVGLFKNILSDTDTDEYTHPTQVSPFYRFMVELVQSLSRAFYAQSETFGKPHVLYILNRGLVGRNIRLHQAGSVWGVDFMLEDSKLLEPQRAFTFTYVELTTLKREDFLKLLAAHSAGCPGLRKRVRHYCCWLALQRALMREAKHRQQLPRHLWGQPRRSSHSQGHHLALVDTNGTGKGNQDEWQPQKSQ